MITADDLRAKIDTDINRGVVIKTTLATCSPGRLDFTVTPGTGFRLSLVWLDQSVAPVAVTAARLVVKAQITSGSPLLEIDNTDAGSKIEIDTTEPNLVIVITADDIDTLIDDAGSSIIVPYWLYATADAAEKCLMWGFVTLADGRS